MTYNTYSFTVAIDINWLLALVSLLATIGTYAAMLHLDDNYTMPAFGFRAFLAMLTTPSALIGLGAAAGAMPVSVALLSVFVGPVAIVGFIAAVLVACVVALETFDDTVRGLKQRASMTYRTVRTYGTTLRQSASNVQTALERR